MDKFKKIIDQLSEKRRDITSQIKELYARKHELQKELSDKTIPYNRYLEAKEMFDITVDLIADAALEASVWDEAREIIFNAMEE